MIPIGYLGLTDDISGEPVLDSGERVVSGGSLLLVYDRRNNRFNPKRGSSGRPTSRWVTVCPPQR